MPGPQHTVSLPIELLEALGDIKGAAQEVGREIKALEKQSLEYLAKGQNVPREIQERLGTAQTKREQLKRDEQIRKTAKDEARHSTLKTWAGILNTHNPHAAIRQLATGNISPHMVAQFGRAMQGFGTKAAQFAPKLGGAIAAGGTVIAGAAVGGVVALGLIGVKRVIDAQEESNRLLKEARSTEKQVATENLSTVMRQRMKRDVSLEELSYKRRLLAGKYAEKGGELDPVSATLEDLTLGIFGSEGRRAQIKARDAKFASERLDLRSQLAKRISLSRLNLTEADHRMIAQSTSLVNMGFFDWALSGILQVTRGERDNIRKAAEQRHVLAKAKGEDAAIDATVKSFYEIPMNRTILREQESHLRIVEADKHARFSQWNPY